MGNSSKNYRQIFVDYALSNLDQIAIDFNVSFTFDPNKYLVESDSNFEIIMETLLPSIHCENLQNKLDQLILKLKEKFDFVDSDGLQSYDNEVFYTYILIEMNLKEYLIRERLRKIALI